MPPKQRNSRAQIGIVAGGHNTHCRMRVQAGSRVSIGGRLGAGRAMQGEVLGLGAVEHGPLVRERQECRLRRTLRQPSEMPSALARLVMLLPRFRATSQRSARISWRSGTSL